MQFLSSVLAALAALSLAGFVSLRTPAPGATPIAPGGAQTNDGGSETPPRK
jgi:hypothetical protein